MKPTLLFIFLILFSISIQAEQWVNYLSIGTSFSGELMTAVCVDTSGNKWFGTGDSGILKFDGVHWNYFNIANSILRDNGINSALTDKNGNLWFGTYNGDYKFDGNNWSAYDTTTPTIQGLNGISIIYDIAFDSSGNRWLGTAEGTIKLTDSNKTFFDTINSGIADDHIATIAIDQQNHKWFGTYKGVSEFNDTTWATYKPSNSGLPGLFVRTIMIDRQNNKWFGTAYGVAKFDGTHWTTYTKSNSGLINNGITKIKQDKYGNIWFATGQGISKFDGNSTWVSYDTTNSGLAYNWIVDMAFDSMGNVWFATYGNGISELINPNTAVRNVVSESEVLTLYPNPTTNELNVNLNTPLLEEVKFCIYNITGKLIFEKRAASIFGRVNFTITTADYEAGMYFIQMSTGSKITCDKFIVTH